MSYDMMVYDMTSNDAMSHDAVAYDMISYDICLNPSNIRSMQFLTMTDRRKVKFCVDPRLRKHFGKMAKPL